MNERWCTLLASELIIDFFYNTRATQLLHAQAVVQATFLPLLLSVPPPCSVFHPVVCNHTHPSIPRSGSQNVMMPLSMRTLVPCLRSPLGRADASSGIVPTPYLCTSPPPRFVVTYRFV